LSIASPVEGRRPGLEPDLAREAASPITLCFSSPFSFSRSDSWGAASGAVASSLPTWERRDGEVRRGGMLRAHRGAARHPGKWGFFFFLFRFFYKFFSYDFLFVLDAKIFYLSFSFVLDVKNFYPSFLF